MTYLGTDVGDSIEEAEIDKVGLILNNELQNGGIALHLYIGNKLTNTLVGFDSAKNARFAAKLLGYRVIQYEPPKLEPEPTTTITGNAIHPHATAIPQDWGNNKS